MNGPEHYLEAERLLEAYKPALETAEAMPDESPRQAEARMIACSNARTLLEKASVHATLALAAATVDAAYDMRGDDLWVKATA